MLKKFTIAAVIAALSALPGQAAFAGILLLNDGSTLNGTVTLVAQAPANVSLQVPGKPARTFKLSEVRTAVFDALSDGEATPTHDFVPWARAQVSEVRRPRLVEMKGNAIAIKDGSEAFNMPKAEVALSAVTGEDRCFVFQKLEWDGEITARLLPQKNTPALAIGLMICEGLASDGPMVAITRSSEAAPGVILSVRSAKGEPESRLAQARPAPIPPVWLRLRRTWDTFRAYESDDGASWSPVGECRVEMDDKKGVFIGVTAFSRGASMSTGFDNLVLGGRRFAAMVPGAADPRLPDVLVRLKSGSVFGGMLQTANSTRSDATIKKMGGENFTVPFSSISSAQFSPTSKEDIEKISSATCGALTRDGDFLEGEVKEVKADAMTVSSVNFGLTTLERRRVTTLVFQPQPTPQPQLIEIRLQDGSLILVKSVSVEKEELVLDEPAIGKIKVGLKDVMSFDRRP